MTKYETIARDLFVPEHVIDEMRPTWERNAKRAAQDRLMAETFFLSTCLPGSEI